jgi:hypothetical protein
MPKYTKSQTNDQLFAGAGKTTPVYGMGARKHGGAQVRGRTAHVQVREQNSGMMPAEDYRAAEFLPALWKDLDRNGAPYVMEGGAIVGQAGLTDLTDIHCYTHQVMPANAGVNQKFLYTEEDVDLTLDVDDGGVALPAAGAALSTRVAAAKESTVLALGNKPLAYTPTHVIGEAWNNVYANQQFSQPVTMKTQWLTMYPVDDSFMYGGSLLRNSGGESGGEELVINVDVATVGVSRAHLGYAPATIEVATPADIVLSGIQTGDQVMPNPYLPGKLISVEDFVRLAMRDTDGNVGGAAASGLNDAVAAWATDLAGSAVVPTVADCYAYALEHVVGVCFKRQVRAEYSAGNFINKDISTEIMTFMAQVPELNLQGTQSDGFEADQETARQFAKSGLANTADVVFINFNIK